MTIQDAIIQALTWVGEDYNRNDQVAPAVILWPDKDRQWEPLLPKFRERLPHLLTLGAFDAAQKTGPAVWLRCMVARTLPEADWGEKTVPVIYLPGVSRQDFRSIEECPKTMLPLMELQFRSAFWTQVSHKDWTVLALLQSAEGGLGLDVARDTATQEAMRLALLKLAETEVKDLTGRRLEAADFHDLMSPDSVRDILAWLNDPKGFQGKLAENDWTGFCQRCQDRLGFHPGKHGSLHAAQLLAARRGGWQKGV